MSAGSGRLAVGRNADHDQPALAVRLPFAATPAEKLSRGRLTGNGAPLKLYGSDTDASTNGSAPPPGDDAPEEMEEQHDFSTLFNAPSYSQFIKTAPNSKAMTYERRVQSMMKAGMVASLNNHQWPDAATFLKHGPGFAKAAGNLAAEDPRAAAIVEMLTAPDSPYVMFFMVAIPMIAQLTRNHQPDIKAAGTSFREKRAERKQAKLSGGTGARPRASKPPITVHIFKREFKIPIRFRVRLPNFRNVFKAFLAPTQFPDEIAAEVFNDESVVKALHKMGIYPRREDASEEE